MLSIMLVQKSSKLDPLSKSGRHVNDSFFFFYLLKAWLVVTVSDRATKYIHWFISSAMATSRTSLMSVLYIKVGFPGSSSLSLSPMSCTSTLFIPCPLLSALTHGPGSGWELSWRWPLENKPFFPPPTLHSTPLPWSHNLFCDKQVPVKDVNSDPLRNTDDRKQGWRGLHISDVGNLETLCEGLWENSKQPNDALSCQDRLACLLKSR